jgi:hypothetical protein
MKLLARTLGVAVLAAALLNASAGVCFCHRGQALRGESPSSAGCCHRHGSSATTSVSAAGSCCQLESAESAATPGVAVQLVPPTGVTALAEERSPVEVRPFAATVLPGSSPPLLALRI